MSEYDPMCPIPVKERQSYMFVGKGNIDVLDSSVVLVDETGIRKQIPVGKLCALLLEPGARISHAAMKLCGQVGVSVLWVGDAGVRLYSAGVPSCLSSRRLLWQAAIALNEEARKKTAQKMFQYRFGDDIDVSGKSVDELRGLEGVRVRALYKQLAKRNNLTWNGRLHGHGFMEFEECDCLNQCITVANSCLYGICECAILVMGLSPAIGFVHWGSSNAFTCDVADLFKFETVVPLAFEIAKDNPQDPEKIVRHKCRDKFRETRLLARIVKTIKQMLDAGKVPEPMVPPDAVFLEQDFDIEELEKCLLS